MPVRVTCPECDAVMSVEDDKRGKRVRCRKCEAPILVPAAKAKAPPPAEEEYDIEVVEDEAPVKKKKPAARDDDQVQAAAPKKKVAAAPPRRRRDDDYEDEEYDEPRGKRGKGQQKSPGLMIALLAVVAVVVLGGAAAAVYFVAFRDKDDHKLVENPRPIPPPPAGSGAPPVPPVSGPAQPGGGTAKADGGAKPDAGTKPDGGAKPDAGADTLSAMDTSKVSRNTIYQYVLKSTAWIITKQAEGAAMGTGSLIDKDNRLVLTNYHVVHGSQDFVVFFPTYKEGRLIQERKAYMERARADDAIRGKIMDVDDKRDLALIQLNRVPDGIEALPVAKQPPGNGEDLHSIGNPGVSDNLWVYTPGHVRGVGEKEWKAQGHGIVFELKAKVVEADSPTNPGDSGGPCCNNAGELVGVTQGGKVGIGVNAMSYFICCTEVDDFLNKAFGRAGDLRGKTWARSKRPPLDKTGGGSKANLPILLAKLKNETSAQVRAEGANGLGLMGPDAQIAIPSLVKALADKDDDVRQFAGDALKSIGSPHADQVPRLLGYLDLPSADARAYVLAAITLLGGSEDAVAPVLKATEDQDAKVRQQAMRALGKLAQTGTLPEKGARPPLDKGLRDADRRVRRSAAEAITTDLASVKADVPNLRELLKNKEPEVGAAAAAALGRLGEKAKPAGPDLIAALAADDNNLRRACFVALKSIGADPVALVPHLRGGIKAEDADVRRAALEAAGQAGPAAKDLVPAIADAVSDPEARPAALTALKLIGPDAAREGANVVAGLLANDKPLRLDALLTLEQMKVNGSVVEVIAPKVLDVFADEDREPVKEKAATVLSRMGKHVLPPLLQGLNNPSPKVRRGAAQSLGAMGGEAKAALPTLQRALPAEKDKATQDEIGAAIQRIANSK
jgi:predicted Zn finger-like uncharacterized protein